MKDNLFSIFKKGDKKTKLSYFTRGSEWLFEILINLDNDYTPNSINK